MDIGRGIAVGCLWIAIAVICTLGPADAAGGAIFAGLVGTLFLC
jgi:hypothetical protein